MKECLIEIRLLVPKTISTSLVNLLTVIACTVGYAVADHPPIGCQFTQILKILNIYIRIVFQTDGRKKRIYFQGLNYLYC